jgi:hypothetical protein
MILGFKILNDLDEFERLKSYQGELDELEEASKFVVGFCRIPRIDIRLKSITYISEFG